MWPFRKKSPFSKFLSATEIEQSLRGKGPDSPIQSKLRSFILVLISDEQTIERAAETALSVRKVAEKNGATCIGALSNIHLYAFSAPFDDSEPLSNEQLERVVDEIVGATSRAVKIGYGTCMLTTVLLASGKTVFAGSFIRKALIHIVAVSNLTDGGYVCLNCE